MKAYKYKLKPSAKIIAIFESWLAILCEKIGRVKVHLSRAIEGEIKTCTIKREADGWYLILAVEESKKEIALAPKESVGVDVGIESFATLSDDEAAPIENPQYFRRAEDDLKKAGRRVSRGVKGSKRRKKAVRLLAKKHLKVKRQRRDFHFKEARKLVAQYQSITVEDLNIRGMVRNHHLAKSISDAGWGQFIAIVIYKAEEAGRTVIKVNPSYTSQECSRCGHRNRITLATRIYRCSQCGLVIHRDRNGAKRIEQKGRAVSSGSRRSVACEEPRTCQATDLESSAIAR